MEAQIRDEMYVIKGFLEDSGIKLELYEAYPHFFPRSNKNN